MVKKHVLRKEGAHSTDTVGEIPLPNPASSSIMRIEYSFSRNQTMEFPAWPGRLAGRFTPALLLSASLSVLAACSSNPYTITFNDNVLYSPSEAIRNAVVDDPGLQGCINGTLKADPTLTLENMRLLSCAGAEIRTLQGIGKLPALEQLELSDNGIDNLSPLQGLRNLRIVGLRNNRLSNIGPLSSLPLLRFVSLQGNDNVLCRQLDDLEKRLGNTLGRPASCIR